MTTSVKIVSASEVTRGKPYSSGPGSNSIDLSREIYINLSSMIKSSSISYHENPETKFEEFMKDLNDLSAGTDDLTDTQKKDLLAVDEYLGSLGLTITYPINQDNIGNQQAVNAHYKGLSHE